MYAIGIDIGGTKCAAVLGKGELPDTPDGFIVDKQSFPTQVERGWEAIVAELLETTQLLLERNGLQKEDILGIGISCGGPLNSRTGCIHCPPNLPDWDNVPIKTLFEERFGARTVLQNDANACAVAEWKFGAGRNTRNMVFLTFGTGMGAGLILDGHLYTGANDMAGEVGHIRIAEDGPEGYGKRGSFEGFCSGGGIARLGQETAQRAAELGFSSPLLHEPAAMTAKSIALAAKAGDAFASYIYDECAHKLGLGLSILIDILNPELIVIGSIYERDRALFDESIAAVLAAEALPLSAGACRILPAALGNHIGDFAALGLVFTE